MNRSTLHRSGGRAFLRRSRWFQLLTTGLLAPGLMTCLSPVQANPRGGVVVHGNVSMGAGAGGNLQIRQNSASAIINWESFSINAGELTQFRQPGRNSAVLNRVTGGDPSAIHGALKGNGNVFVINPNGILVGAGGTIDVHGLVLSTLDVNNGEFLAGGDQVFQGAGDKGVTNLGRINAIGGDVFLIGKTVSNAGSITASSGRVGLAAGEEVLLTAAENPTGERIFVRAKGSGVSGTGIFNDGSIEGAAVEMKAHGNIYALAINNKGSVRATGTSNSGGRVYLRGVGGSVSNSGSIRATHSGGGNAGRVLIEAAYAKVDGQIRARGGTVRVSATEQAELGGTIDVSSQSEKGGEVVVEGTGIAIGSSSTIDASGLEGGSVRIGGGFQGRDLEVRNAETLVVESGSLIRANGEGGDAGTVILWSDDRTQFSGEVRADATGNGHGGFVEVSGKETLQFEGLVSTVSESGQNGTLLLDPTNFAVIAGGVGAGGTNQISNTDLINQLALGNVVIATDSAGSEDGTITVATGAEVLWTSSNSLALLAHGDIRFNASVQASGTGGVTAVAGWNGTTGFGGGAGVNPSATVNFADFVANPASYGQNNRSVFIGSASSGNGVAVGSRGGSTSIFGHGVFLSGGNVDSAYAQLGYRPKASTQATSGDLNVYLHGGGVNLTAGIANHSFAQIGHGGRSSTNVTNGPLSGNIWIESTASGNVSLLGGTAASSDGAAAIIGHGGLSTSGNRLAKIDLRGVGAVHLQGGLGTNGLAQIGHVNARGGGSTIAGTDGSGSAYQSDIYLEAAGEVNLSAGQGSASSAQIGHGGILAGAATNLGNITVISGASADVVLNGGGGQNANAVIGHGGRSNAGDHTGAITVRAGGAILGAAGSGQRAAVMIGHGGSEGNRPSPAGNTGDIELKAASGNIILIGGIGTEAWAQVGHGGSGNNGDHRGDISVIAPQGSIEFRWLDTGSASDTPTPTTPGTLAYVQLGHGGANASGNHGGNIEVLAGTEVLIQSSISATTGRNGNYAQLGHGGINVVGNHSGNISVLANTGSVKLRGGSRGGGDRYAHVGHGGAYSIGSHVGDISVLADQHIILENITTGTAALRSYTQLGHGGYASVSALGHDATISVATRKGDLSLLAAPNISQGSYIQLGHGGLDATGAHQGNVLIRTGNQILARAGVGTGAGGGADSYVQIGHGGGVSGALVLPADDYAGDITIRSQRGGNYSDIGDFFDASGEFGGDGVFDVVVVQSGSATTALSFQGGLVGTTNQYAQLGHGGFGRVGNHSGDITTESRGTASFTGGAGVRGYAQLGHGGLGSVASSGHLGDISMTVLGIASSGSILFTAGTGLESYVQFGHGGSDSSGGHKGDISALAEYVIRFQANASNVDGYRAYAQLGHGGYGSAGSHTGKITGRAFNGEMTFLAGLSDQAATDGVNDERYVQVGHGGTGSVGNHTGAVTLEATGRINATGGGGVGSYAQVGHGGLGSIASSGHLGDIATRAGASSGSIQFNAGIGLESYAQQGHGGLGSLGNHFGNISALAENELYFRTTSANTSGYRAYAQLGHGGYGSNGSHTGDITALADGGAMSFNAGRSGDAVSDAEQDDRYVLVGHGGTDSAGSHLGNLALLAQQSLTLSRGSGGVGGFVQVGHGGLRSTAANGHTGNIGMASRTGAVEGALTSGGIDPTINAYSQIGHGGGYSTGDHEGHVVVRAADQLRMYSHRAEGSGSYVQVGHGGLMAPGSHEGNLTMSSQIGGSFNDIGDFDLDGSFDSVSLTAGSNSEGFLIIGNNDLTEHNDAYAQVGHGGAGSPGSHSGNIHLDSNEQIRLIAGLSGARGYAQIGHGGYDAAPLGGGAVGETTGDIFVRSRTGLVDLRWGGTTVNAVGNYIQIGHGGYVSSGNQGRSDLRGAIAVEAAGNLLLQSITGGTSVGNYVQVGHGGMNWAGDHGGNISTHANNITLTAGAGSSRYAQIGHGGTAVSNALAGNSHLTGSIGVVARGKLSMSTSNGTASSVQIGHGGSNWTGGIVSDAEVKVDVTGDISLLSGTASGGYAQIGHGGFDSMLMEVTDSAILINTASGTGTGDLSLTARSTNAYAQIGHGGSRSDSNAGFANKSGDIVIGAARNITLSSGTATDAYTQIGHGGEGGNSSGNKAVLGGSIEINATGGINLIGGSADDTYAQIGHGGDRSRYDISGQILVKAGAALALTGGTAGTGEAYAQIGHGGSGTVGDVTDSHLVVIFGNGLTMQAGTVLSSDARIGHGGVSAQGETHGDISITGIGNVTLSGSDLAQASSQIGHGGRLAAGAKSGDVLVDVSGGVELKAGGFQDAFVQIGHGGQGTINTGNTRGNIAMQSGGKISVLGGKNLNAYAQIGHGGQLNRNNHGAAGDRIVVVAATGIDLIGGTTTNAIHYGTYAQIGNGGYEAIGLFQGDIYLNYDPDIAAAAGGGDIRLDGGNGFNGSYAQVGHGGRNSKGDKSGDIIIGRADHLSLDGGSNSNYVLIGHGGNSSATNDLDGAMDGVIRILQSNRVSLKGGTTNSFAQIGHGGSSMGGATEGEIEVRSDGDITLAGGGTGSYTQIGLGGLSADGKKSGNIGVFAAGNVSLGGLTSGIGNSAYTMIGNGGLFGSGDTDGNIEVRAGGKVSLVAGSFMDTFALIGHGGRERRGNHGLATNHTIVIGGNGISLQAGSANVTGLYAQIGSGGYNIVAESEAKGNIYLNYDPYLDALAGGGNLEVKASTGGTGAYAQVGHGGRLHNGSKSGDIVIGKVDDLIMHAGAGSNLYAQIGHGGNDNVDGDRDGDIEGAIRVVEAKNISITGGDTNSYALLGHGGWLYDATISDAVIDLTFTGRIDLIGGTNTFGGAQIGHGGANSMNLVVAASDILIHGGGAGDILFTSTVSNGYTQIGHGGARSDANPNFANKSGDIAITGLRDLTMKSGSAIDAYTQIGHGGEGGSGAGSSGVLSGNILVEASGSLLMQAGISDDTYSQIGHGGEASLWDVDGGITMLIGGDVLLEGGNTGGASNYAQIGHGGAKSTGSRAGALEVVAGGNVSLTGGTTSLSYAKIGHGGSGRQGALSGNITVEGDNIRLKGSIGTDASAQIGHGGSSLPAGVSVSNSHLLINAFGAIDLIAGTGAQTYSQIGHGGFNSQYLTTINSDIRINHAAGSGGGDIYLKAGGTGANSYSQIGHGGSRTDGNVGGDLSSEGDILINRARNILIEGGTGTDTYAQIGHGGERGQGVYQGDIRLNITGSLNLQGGQTAARTFARVGHGGHSGGAQKSGDIWVNTGAEIRLQGGNSGTQSFVQIGHGGVDSTGDANGALHLVTGGNLDIVGGSAISNYALVGHGGTTTAGLPTAGFRQGDLLIQVEGRTSLSDQGAYAYLTHRGASGINGASRFALVTGTIDFQSSVQSLRDLIQNMIGTGSVEIGVRNGDLLLEGAAAQFMSDHHVDLFASGDVIMHTLVESGGLSDITLLAGWDGSSGWNRDIRPLEAPLIQAFSLDAATASWGNNGGTVTIGGGSQTAIAAVGSAQGTTTVLGHAVEVLGSETTAGAYAQIGSSLLGTALSGGDIVVRALAGGIVVEAGDQVNAFAHIGHRVAGTLAGPVSGDIEVVSGGKLDLHGGNALQAFAQIGHGGVNAGTAGMSGAIKISTLLDITAVSGLKTLSYTQIGHGGILSDADLTGDIQIASGGSIELRSLAPELGTYAKIGHGDDLRGSLVALGSTGQRMGNVEVSAAHDLTMEAALIGHLGSESLATAAGGHTWIGVARADPTDPTKGKLIADAASEFSGAEEVRFYLPRRENNQIAAGAKINGEVFDGEALYDPWPVQRPDEFTNFLIDANGVRSQPGEHDNSFGSGPVPLVSGLYAMYFDQIALGGSFPPDPVDPVGPGQPGGPGGGGIPGGGPGPVDPWANGYASAYPDDRTFDDWLREQEEEVTGWGYFRILYEGFEQYGPHGESTFRYDQ